jgi:(2R)-3-sulfolactate dehydrogenase (NADP+)
MSEAGADRTVTTGAVLEQVTALLAACDVPVDAARLTAKALTLTESWGVTSHGLMRLPYYLMRLREGGIRAGAEVITVQDTGPVVAQDGQDGLGHWQLWRAAELAAERCRSYGLAAVSVGRSSHCGCLGVYTLPIVDAGQLALIFSNGPAVMPPWEGNRPVLSTSPLAAGIPCRPRPALVDLATSAVARGRIAERARRKEPLQPGWALDCDGVPTVDAQAALAGMLAPLGGVKGFAIALLVEALTGGLVGPALSTDVADMFDADAVHRPQRISHLVLAIDPERVDVDGDARRRLDELAKRVVSAGGRLPGVGRRHPREIPPDEPLVIAGQTAAELDEWERLLLRQPAGVDASPPARPRQR